MGRCSSQGAARGAKAHGDYTGGLRMKLGHSVLGCEAQLTECRPGRCGRIATSKTIAARMTTEAKGRLRASPPWLTGLSRKSPTVAPRGRVRMKAAQNRNTRDTLLQ